MAAHIAQRLPQLLPAPAALRAAPTGIAVGALGRPPRHVPVAQAAQRYHGEDAPPQAGGGQADAHRRALGDAEGVVPGEQRQIGDEHQRPGRVAERPAPGGHRVAFLGLGYLRQEGVVEHHRHHERHVRDDQQRSAQQIALAAQEEHPGRGRGARVRAEAQQGLLPAGAVDQRRGERHRQHGQQQRRRDRVREERARAHRHTQRMHKTVGVRRGLRHRRQIGPEEDRQDARRVDAVGPVVPIPAALFAAPGSRLRHAPRPQSARSPAHPRIPLPVGAADSRRPSDPAAPPGRAPCAGCRSDRS